MKLNISLQRNLLKMFLIIISVLIFGCSHSLTIKNLHQYHNPDFNGLSEPATIGIINSCSSSEYDSQRLLDGISSQLSKYSGVIFPFSTNKLQKADYIASINIKPEYKGSGWNFLINWPGFLIFLPAINGYIYEANYDIEVSLTKGNDNEKVDSFTLPVRFNMRQADIGRTWISAGWFEFGIIPLIGGIFFVSYDENITPQVIDKIEYQIGDYVAQKIISRINKTQRIDANLKQTYNLGLSYNP